MSSPYTKELQKNQYGETLPQHYNEATQDYEPSRGDRDGLHVKDQQAVHALQELSQLYQQGRQDPVVAGLLEEILELMIDRPEVQPVHDEPSYDELVKINGYLTEQLDTIYQLLHGIDAHIKEVFTPTMWDRIIKIHKVNE